MTDVPCRTTRLSTRGGEHHGSRELGVPRFRITISGSTGPHKPSVRYSPRSDEDGRLFSGHKA